MDINLTLIGQMGTFLVLWWFINKYVWPLFKEASEIRQQKIAEGLSMADKARHNAETAEQESAELVTQAKNRAADIIGRAQKQAEQLVSDARLEAKTVGEKEIAAARENFEQEKRKVRQELREQLSDLVIAGTTQVLGREVKADDHKRLLRELSEKL